MFGCLPRLEHLYVGVWPLDDVGDVPSVRADLTGLPPDLQQLEVGVSGGRHSRITGNAQCGELLGRWHLNETSSGAENALDLPSCSYP